MLDVGVSWSPANQSHNSSFLFIADSAHCTALTLPRGSKWAAKGLCACATRMYPHRVSTVTDIHPPIFDCLQALRRHHRKHPNHGLHHLTQRATTTGTKPNKRGRLNGCLTAIHPDRQTHREIERWGHKITSTFSTLPSALFRYFIEASFYSSVHSVG